MLYRASNAPALVFEVNVNALRKELEPAETDPFTGRKASPESL
jgi:hypothetical protein